MLTQLGDTVSRGEDDARSNERAATLEQVHLARLPGHLLLDQHCAHVWPLPKLGLVVREAILDAHTNTIPVTLAALGRVFCHRRWRRWHKIWISAADVQKSWTLALLRAENPKTISDVNQASAIRDDASIVTLVVWDTFVPPARRVVGTILKNVVNRSGCLVGEGPLRRCVVIRGNIAGFVCDHLHNHLVPVELARMLSTAAAVGPRTAEDVFNGSQLRDSQLGLASTILRGWRPKGKPH